MTTRIRHGAEDGSDVHGGSGPEHHQKGEDPHADEATFNLLTDDPLTGLPWTETLLPLIMNWGASRKVHAVCIHFIGLGTLANIREFQSSQSILKDAAARLLPIVKDDDRLTRYSGNKLLLFSTRADEDVASLVEAIRTALASLGAEVNGQRIPQVRFGAAALTPPERPPVTMDAITVLLSSAEEATTKVTERLAPSIRSVEAEAPAGASAPAPVQASVIPQPTSSEPAPPEFSDEKTTPREESEPIMIVRGHPDRTPIRSTEAAVDTPSPRTVPMSEHRLILAGVEVHVTGMVATALVELTFDGRTVRGKAIGRSSEKGHAQLVAEAVARSVTDLLPAGHGAVFRQAVSVSTDFGAAVVTVVEFLAPDSAEFLFGVAPVDGESKEAVAESILSAVNRRTARMIDGSVGA